MAERLVDISGEVRSICAKLGLDPCRVARLDVSSSVVVAEVFIPDEDGTLRVVDGAVPMGTVTTQVRT